MNIEGITIEELYEEFVKAKMPSFEEFKQDLDDFSFALLKFIKKDSMDFSLYGFYVDSPSIFDAAMENLNINDIIDDYDYAFDDVITLYLNTEIEDLTEEQNAALLYFKDNIGNGFKVVIE